MARSPRDMLPAERFDSRLPSVRWSPGSQNHMLGRVIVRVLSVKPRPLTFIQPTGDAMSGMAQSTAEKGSEPHRPLSRVHVDMAGPTGLEPEGFAANSRRLKG